MKLTLSLIAVLLSVFASAQTRVSSTTPISTIATMKPGKYFYMVGKDTTYFNKDTAMILTNTVTVIKIIRDTLPRICPVCPVCPPIPAQRVVTGLAWSGTLQRWVITYNNGSTSNL